MSHPDVSCYASTDSKTFRLSQAILFYKNRENSAYATIHGIQETSSGPIIGCGAPLTRQNLRKWMDALNTDQSLTFLSDKVLAKNTNTIVWWTPPAMHQSYFNLSNAEKDPKIKNLNKKTVCLLPYPGLIFSYHGSTLSVFATKSKERPTPETELFHAPILNTYKDGKICLGNAKRPKLNSPTVIEEAEHAVFNTWSTHTNSNETTLYKAGLERLWDTLITSKRKSFPLNTLLPILRKPNRNEPQNSSKIPMTLGDMLKQF